MAVPCMRSGSLTGAVDMGVAGAPLEPVEKVVTAIKTRHGIETRHCARSFAKLVLMRCDVIGLERPKV